MTQQQNNQRIEAGDSLKRNLLRSHLTVAFLGVLALSVGIFTSIWIQQSALHLSNKTAVAAQASMQIQNGLLLSLSAMHGWVTVGDGLFKTERMESWKKEIRPAFRKLETVAATSADEKLVQQLTRVKRLLDDLEQWQWRIEDVAQTPGNEPATVLMTRRAGPTIDAAFTGVTAIIELEKSFGTDLRWKRLLALTSDFRSYLAASQSDISAFIGHPTASSRSRFGNSFTIAKKSLEALLGLKAHLSPQQRDALDWVKRNVYAFDILAQRNFT